MLIVFLHVFVLTQLGRIVGNPIQANAKIGKNITSNESHALVSSIPDTIVSLNDLKLRLEDVLEDFKDVVDINETNPNAFAEGNTPLTVDDINDIELKNGNPIDPEKTEPEEDAPMDITSQQESGKSQAPPKHVAVKNVEEEVCGR